MFAAVRAILPPLPRRAAAAAVVGGWGSDGARSPTFASPSEHSFSALRVKKLSSASERARARASA